MEVVLAVITLATAVKDVVELADKIHASFEKVSNNLRGAQVLAGEIKQTINELKEFCEEHGATLENDRDLRAALLELTAKLRQFDSDIVPLIASPSPSPQLLRRVEGGFKEWRNGGRIDTSIRQLKEEVKKCQMNFVMMSVARMQVKLHQMHISTGEGFRVIRQGMSDILVAHNTTSFSLQPLLPSSQGLFAASHQNIVAFAQTSSSTSTLMLKTPSAMQIIRDSYLKEQVDSIAALLSNIPTRDITYSSEPPAIYASPFTPLVVNTVQRTYRNPERLHRDVVMRALEIRHTLENLPTSTSVKDGAFQLVTLTVELNTMGMLEEAIKMGKWARRLFQMLIGAGKVTHSPHLVQSLETLSLYHNAVGNHDSALSAIEGAVRISEGLQSTTTPVEIQVQHGSVLSTYAEMMLRIKNDHKRAIKLAEQSVKLMENINGIGLPSLHKEVDRDVQARPLFLARLYQVSPSNGAIAEYARALRVLSNCLMADGRLQESLDAKLRALPIFYDTPSLIMEDMDTELARILYELVTQKCKSLLPAEKILEYAEDCARIYRRHAELNAPKYGWSLCNVLWEKGNALNILNRDSDALEVWKEIANIAQQVIQDQSYYANALAQVSRSFRRLKRHEEAVSVRTQSVLIYKAVNNTTTASQANGLYELCVDYQLAMRFPEAVDAAKKAVAQYRVLAFVEPDKWAHPIGRALSALANSLFSSGDYEAALNAGHESMQIFESHIKTDPECVKSYIYSLRVNIGLAVTINNERTAFKRMDDVLSHMRQLTFHFPEDATLALLEAELDYAHNLNRLDHIQEARKYLEELIAKWEIGEHPHVNKHAFTNLHISALISYASILDNQGHSDLALVPIRKGVGIGKPFSAASPVLAGQTVGAMYRHAYLLVELGRYDEALVVAEGTLKFIRQTKTDNASSLINTLHVVGLAAGYTHTYDRVVKVSQEAVDICKSLDFVEYCQIDPRSLCLLSHSLQLLSSGHANSGNSQLGLQYGEEAVKEAKALCAMPRLATADVEQYYMEANNNLGVIYLVHHQLDAACRTFEETRAYFTEKVKERIGQSENLISILRRLGIIHCSEGRHDEGHAAAQEAKAYLDHLAEDFPALYDLIHIYVRHELTIPSLQVLNRMKENLPCNHQADLSF